MTNENISETKTIGSSIGKKVISRRKFIVSTAAGGGILFGFTIAAPLSRAAAVGGGSHSVFLPTVSYDPGPDSMFLSRPPAFRAAVDVAAVNTGLAPMSTSTSVPAFIRIEPDGSIAVLIGSSEMGQGVMTGLAMIVAEELMVDWNQVHAEHAPSKQGFGNPLFGGFQLTGGSSSIRGYYNTLRNAGATVREMMIAAGAQTMGVTAAECTAAHGKVTVTASGASKTYGELAALASTLTPPASAPLTPSSAFRLIGKSQQRLDIPSKVNGSAIFGLDVKIPGMVYAAIKHCPSLGGTVVGTPAKPAGAIAVVPLGNAVAVVADNTWKANELARSLQVRWSIPTTAADIETGKIMTKAKSLMVTGTALAAEPPVGDAVTALSAASKKIDVTYDLPYLAHACMEVLNCTANVTATSVDVWAPTQGQGSLPYTASAITGLPPTAVTVHTTMLGGGLGRKFEMDFHAQAITISKVLGKPVHLTWSREEDFGRDQYRPMALVNVKAGVDTANNLSAFAYRNVSPSILGQRGNPLVTADGQATEGSTSLPYAIANKKIEWVAHPSAVPVGFWRSVGHSINVFAVESAIDELALAAGIDPLTFRRNLLANNPRYLNVLNAAAALGNWTGALPAGHARGIALAESFGSIVAEVAEVSAPTAGAMTVHSVAVAIDCGVAVNPQQIEAQMQGCVVHGLSSAMWGKINFTNGTANVRNFNSYRMLRMREMPKVSVQIIETAGVPIGGVGEPGVPPLAPAIANAYARLTGKRLRSLPLFPAAGSQGGG